MTLLLLAVVLAAPAYERRKQAQSPDFDVSCRASPLETLSTAVLTWRKLSGAVQLSNSVSTVSFTAMLNCYSPLAGRLHREPRLFVNAAAPPVNVGVNSRSFGTARRVAWYSKSSDSARALHSGSWNRASVAPATQTLPPAAAAASPAAAAQQLSSDGLRSCAVALAKVADDTKALDISCLHVEPVVSWTSYMVLCTGGA